MRLVWIAVLTLMIAMSEQMDRKELRMLISHKIQKKQNRHQLLAHPFGDELAPVDEESSEEVAYKQPKDQQQPKDSTQTSTGPKSQELEPQWHFYFAAMIVATLVGMKILNVWEERIHQKYEPQHKPSKKPAYVEYFQNEFEEQMNLASLP